MRVAATATSGLAQYLPNGDPDPNFGTNGKVFTEFGDQEYVYTMAVDSNGRIVVGGNFGMARYLADGTLDLTFGVDGLLTILTNVQDIAIDNNDRIVASAGNYVQRFNADSSVDQSFNSGQRVYLYSLISSFYAYDIVVDAADQIVLTGYRYNPFVDDPGTPNFNERDNSNYDIIVARLTTSGQLDTTFAPAGPNATTGGYATVSYHSGYAQIDYGGRTEFPNALIMQGSHIVVGGYTDDLYDSVNETSLDPTGEGRFDADLVLLRLDGNGILDTTFGLGGAEGDGLVQTHLGSWEYAYSLGIGSQAELLVGGNSFWTRYSADGILDTSLNPLSSYPGRVTGYVSTVYGIQEWVDPGTGDRFVFVSGNRSIGGDEGSNFAVAKHNGVDGALDPTFGTGGSDNIDGLVTTDFEGSQYDEIRDLVITQPDGKIVVAGYKSGGVTDLVLARYLSDGSLDPTFGAGDGDGIDGVVIDGRYSSPQAMAIDSAGRIVVAYSNRLLRYNSDGTPDNTFGPGTSDNRVYAGSQFSYIYDIEADATGRILASGYRHQTSPDNTVSSADLALARYNVDGSLDTSFSNGDADGVDGVHYLDLGSSDPVRSEEYLHHIAIDLSGKILATGYSYAYDHDANQYVRRGDIALLRYNADGTLDTSFGVGSSSNSDNSQVIENVDGLVLTDFNKNSFDYGYAVTVDSQGRIYAGGNNNLASYNSDGTLNTNFSGDGKANVTGYIRSLAIDSSDKIVMGGSNRLARYHADGTPDTDFASNGRLYINDRYIEAIAIDSTGRIVVGGRTGSSGASGVDFFVGRYLTGGLSVTVNNVAPQNVSVMGTTSTDEGQLISLSASATDPAGIYDPLTYTWSITRNNVAFLQTSGQNIAFIAPDDGTYVALMTVDDGDGGSVTLSHTTTVANLDPTANDDTADVDEDGPSVTVDVLADDTDPVGAADPLTVTGVDTTGTLGSVSFTSGNVTYHPNGQFESLAVGESTTDSFTYDISDGDGGRDTGTAIVTINGSNDAPEITVSISDSAAETLTETNAGLSVSDTLSVEDLDTTDTVSVAVSSVAVVGDDAGLGNPALLGMLSVDAGNVIDNANTTGTITWTFNSGSEAFNHLAVGESLVLTYTVTTTDSQSASDTQNVTIAIDGSNDAPAISADNASVAVDEGDTANNGGAFDDVDTHGHRDSFRIRGDRNRFRWRELVLVVQHQRRPGGIANSHDHRR